MTTFNQVGVATTITNGNTALSSFSQIQRNRGTRFQLDLSSANVVQVLMAYQEKRRKANPNYSIRSSISLIRAIEESERQAAETSIPKTEWAGPFQPIDICADFWVAFESFYLNTPASNGMKRHASSAETYANQIIAALAWGQAYGVRLDPSFREKRFGRYEKKKITPSQDQLSHIYHFDLDCKENRKRIRELAEDMQIRRFSFSELKKARDHFVLGCSLGQRISDSKRITPANFTGDSYETTQQKTGRHAKVNIKECAIDYDVVQEILARYNHEAPAHNMDTGVYNRYLHLLCRAIGGTFDRIVTWEYKEQGEIRHESAPVWKLITSHVARRTFITHQLEVNKQSISRVMRESGHADTRNLHKYFAPEHQ